MVLVLYPPTLLLDPTCIKSSSLRGKSFPFASRRESSPNKRILVSPFCDCFAPCKTFERGIADVVARLRANDASEARTIATEAMMVSGFSALRIWLIILGDSAEKLVRIA